jgi:hypothetical protein
MRSGPNRAMLVLVMEPPPVTLPAARPSPVHAAIGICILTVGILLLLHSYGKVDLVEALRFWPLAIVLIGGAVIWEAIRGGPSSTGIGPVIVVIVGGLLFAHVLERRSTAPVFSNGQLNVFNVLGGGDGPQVHGAFTGGRITAFMAGTNLDLRHATLAPGQTAVLDVFATMGGGAIHVPADWTVEFDTTTIMGGVSDHRHAPPHAEASVPEGAGAPPPHLIVHGTLLMGGLSIEP